MQPIDSLTGDFRFGKEPPMEERLRKQLEFALEIDKEKNILRQTHLSGHGRRENDAEHAWHMAIMAYLLREYANEEVDIAKVMLMCLIHDIGEAVTGDIPTFDKTTKHEEIEKLAVDNLLKNLPDCLCQEFTALFSEMEALETREAKVYKALDKLEAVIQHNESDPSTWLPLEFDLQKTYAAKSVQGFPFLEKIQDQLVEDTDEIIAEYRKRSKTV